MIRRPQVLALLAATTLGLSSLVGCSSSSTPSATLPDAATSSATPSDTAANSPALADEANVNGLSRPVADTKAAVEAGDFATAKVTAQQIEDAWKQVEDGVKDKDKTAYDAIETHLDELQRGLKGSNPDATALTTHLTELDTAIASVSK